jgi:membrane-associated protease RseP (regulator of RpoE activity)
MMIRTCLSLFAMLFATPLYAQEPPAAGYNPDSILALKSLQLLDQRMNAIGYRLVEANTPYCTDRIAQAGLLLHDIDQYPDQPIARFALGFDGPIAINAVAADSPGAAAGLLAGDDILAINGMKVTDIPLDDPEIMKEALDYRRIAAVNNQLDHSLSQGDVVLEILRGGEQRQVTVESRPSCPSRFQIEVSADRGASANGKIVSVTSQLAEYFLNDDEFAAVIAHELAHNLLKHRDELDAQSVNRGFFGQLGKSAGRIKATEIEADRLSIWLMINAGYDPQAAIRFWTRYGKEHGKGIFSASTHYRWKKRVELFEQEIAKMATMQPVDGKYAPPLLVKVN